MMRKKTFYQLFGKRILDILLSGIALIVLSPIILIVGILVRIKLGSPIIFKQERPGKSEKIFSMYKFRTMTDERDHNGEYLPDEIRLTKFGKMLRATSLDELPELWNILKGDMSIVGPRPLLVEYLPLYSEKQRKRHNVRPGLTGLAQVNGRNAISWEEKFDLDVYYVDKISFFNDFIIIIQTCKKVIKKENINTINNNIPEKFKGVKYSMPLNILFLTLLDFQSLEESNIYTDLMSEFVKNNHNVSIISPVERKKEQKLIWTR